MSTKHAPFLAVLLAAGAMTAGVVSHGWAQTPVPAADKTAITALVARYNEARDLKDPAAIGSIFTEDADQLVSTGEWRRGRDTLVQGMLRSSQSLPGDRTITVETVRLLGPEVAVADARYEIANPGGEPRRMWSTFLAVRTADGWRIAGIRNMLPAK